MHAYPKEYLEDVVKNQGKLFDFVAQSFKDKDTKDFINTYMSSKTRKSIDNAMSYVCTMDQYDLWTYFCKTENYILKTGKAIEGFVPDWIGEFYAYYQWFYNIPSAVVVNRISVDFLTEVYHGLHDLDIDLAVMKVGAIR